MAGWGAPAFLLIYTYTLVRDMISNPHKFPFKVFYFLFIIVNFISIPQFTHAVDYNRNCDDPQAYLLEKLNSHEIVFLGTRHKKPPILKFISGLIPKLHNSGVTHIGLEITSGQHYKINKFIKTGAGLSDIQIHPQIDCPEYRNLLNALRALDPNKRPTPIAIDLPKSKYNEPISRDEWMAKSVSKIFQQNPNVKMLVIVGNNHVLKKLDWQDHVPNPHRSIWEYLLEKRVKRALETISGVT